MIGGYPHVKSTTPKLSERPHRWGLAVAPHLLAQLSSGSHGNGVTTYVQPYSTAADAATERELSDEPGAEAVLTELYRAHALRLIRLGYVMLGDRQAAEDVVQDAFAGLYRRWGGLTDHAKALHYLRSSVLNGCRTAIKRHRPVLDLVDVDPVVTSAETAETAVLAGEQQRALMNAIRQLPIRQREALVLRFYLDEPDAEIARLMGIRESTVRSTTHRALAALGRLLGEQS
jgi:RNA polymerase sigma-70 factor (sigma-E family)